MALFKELTDVAEGSKIVVNMDVVRYLQRIKDMTSIYLGTTMQLRSRKPERIPDVEGALRCVAGEDALSRGGLTTGARPAAVATYRRPLEPTMLSRAPTGCFPAPPAEHVAPAPRRGTRSGSHT